VPRHRGDRASSAGQVHPPGLAEDREPLDDRKLLTVQSAQAKTLPCRTVELSRVGSIEVATSCSRAMPSAR
jgi:hypothetical protein